MSKPVDLSPHIGDKDALLDAIADSEKQFTPYNVGGLLEISCRRVENLFVCHDHAGDDTLEMSVNGLDFETLCQQIGRENIMSVVADLDNLNRSKKW